MSTITTIDATDVISGSRAEINTNFSNLNTDKIETSTLDTDTTLAANSDSKIATQKATKTYVDANVNPTGRSWNEYAAANSGSDSYTIAPSGVTAYVTGQTFKFKADVANTGACSLNVNGLGAKTIKKDVSSDLATGDILANQLVVVTYDGTNMQLTSTEAGLKDATQLVGSIPAANLPTNAFFQYIPYGTEIHASVYAVGSSQDGSTLFIHGSTTNELKRFARDANSGMFFFTHEVSVTTGYHPGSLVVVGSYIYIFGDNGNNMVCYRYLAADLTGEQLMTFATPIDLTGATYYVHTWTDGTYIYGVSAKSATTSYKWSISGTTLTQVSTATVTTGIFSNPTSSSTTSFYDGTNAYIMDASTSTISIRKITTLDGTAYSSSTISLPRMSENSSEIGNSAAGILINIDSTRMYVGRVVSEANATAESVSKVFLMPVTKP